MQPAASEPDRSFIETARRAQIVAGAIDTIAELGYAQASLARIAERIGISRGLISYHFAGKEELISEIVRGVLQEARDYMVPRITAETTGPGMLRAYIESNLGFMRAHRNELTAIVEIARHRVAGEIPRPLPDHDADEPVRALAALLAGFQESGDFRPDFDPRVMAIMIRSAIDAVAARLAREAELDVDAYACQILDAFQRATRGGDEPGPSAA